jgi:hypothetical protein
MSNKSGKSQINSFGAGMDLDLDKSLLKDNQYRYAENIRSIMNDTASTGSLSNIEGSYCIGEVIPTDETIIASTTVRDKGVVFTRKAAREYIKRHGSFDLYKGAGAFTSREFYNGITGGSSGVVTIDIDIVNASGAGASTFRDFDTDTNIVVENMLQLDFASSVSSATLSNLDWTLSSYTASNSSISTYNISNTKIFHYVFDSNRDIIGIQFPIEYAGVPDIISGATRMNLTLNGVSYGYPIFIPIVSIEDYSSVVPNSIRVNCTGTIDLENINANLGIELFQQSATMSFFDSPYHDRYMNGVLIDSSSVYIPGITFVPENKYVHRSGDISIFNRQGTSNITVFNTPWPHELITGDLVSISSSDSDYALDEQTVTVINEHTFSIPTWISERYINLPNGVNKIYRLDFPTENTVTHTCIVNPDGLELNINVGSTIDIVTRYESDRNIKVYWADGNNFLRCINISSTKDSYNQSIYDVSAFDMVSDSDLTSPQILGLGSGKLQSGLIQYCYQLYTSVGGETLLSPLSNLVSLTDSVVGSKNSKYTGLGLGAIYGKNTGKSVKLKVLLPDTNIFVGIKLISVYYFDVNSSPVISLIKDSKISVGQTSIGLEDSGATAIGEITIEEFNLIGKNILKPNSIESKDNILFAANYTEDTWDVGSYDTRSYQFKLDSGVYKTLLFNADGTSHPYLYSQLNTVSESDDAINSEIYETNKYSDLLYKYNKDGHYGGSGLNVDYLFSNTYFIESYDDFWTKKVSGNYTGKKDRYIDRRTARIGDKNRLIDSVQFKDSDGIKSTVSLSNFGIERHNGFLNYSNPLLSNAFASYMRDEIYRFAAVFYDKKGRRSPARWIADIRFPAGYETSSDWSSNSFEMPEEQSTLDYTGYLPSQELLVKPLGLKFTFRNIPTTVKKIEIVRAKRDNNNKTVYGQGALQKVGTQKNEYYGVFGGNVGIDKTKILNNGISGTLRPHPILSMGYLYSIAAPIYASNQISFDTYVTFNGEGYCIPTINYSGNSDRETLYYTDHAISPYFANKSFLGLVTPETCYYGVDYIEKLRDKSNSMKLEVVDIISPLATPTFIWETNGGGSSATSYYGNLKDKLTSALKVGTVNGVDGSVIAKYSSGMFLGADINTKNYATGYNPNNDYMLLPIGFAGCISNFASGYPGDRTDEVIDYSDPLSSGTDNSKKSAGNSADVSDILVSGPGPSQIEPGARVFLSGGGVIRYQDINRFDYKSGIDNSNIDTNSVSKPRTLSNTANDNDSSSTTFKYFSRYAQNDAAGNQFKLVKLNSNSAEDRTVSAYYSIKSIPTFSIDNFEYSGDIIPGKKIGEQSASYISIGDKSYLNWAKPLTYGSGTSYADSDPDQGDRRFSNAASRSKIQGIHGPQIIMSFDGDNIIPSILEVQTSKKVFTDGVFDEGLVAIERATTSQLSTYIVNIKNMNAGIYGGKSLLDRQFTEYISTGAVIEVSSTDASSYVFGGDTFIGLLDYTVVHATDPMVDFSKYSSDTYSSEPISLLSQTNHVGALIPLESSINMHLVNSKAYVADDYNFNIQNEPGVYGPALSAGGAWTTTQDHKQYDYNAAYSAEQIALGHTSKLLTDIDNKNFDSRVAYSNVKTNDEIYDSWMKFKPANYMDVDSKYGKITKLKTFKSRLFFWQDKSFGVLAVNERSLIKDNNISSLTLGTSGILSRFDYVSINNGFKFKTIGGISNSESNIYWFDIDNNEMCVFNGDVSSVSKGKGIQSILNKSVDELSNNIPMIYDKKYNELILTLYGIRDASTIE